MQGCSQRTNNQQYGITLVETLIVIAIIALLAFFAVPAYTQTLRKYETLVLNHALVDLLHEARIASLMEKRHIVVCPSENKSSCIRSNSLFIMSFVDSNQNQQREPDETLLSIVSTKLNHGYINFNVSFGRTHIRYFPDTGRPRGHTGNITYCPNDGDMSFAQSVIIDATGRARIAIDLNNDGIADRQRGLSVSC